MSATRSSREEGKRPVRTFVIRSSAIFPEVSRGARNAVVSGTRRFGRAGTGIKISKLRGAAQASATKAAIGFGPKWKGGFGTKGGNVVLAIVAATPWVVALGMVVAEEAIKAKAKGGPPAVDPSKHEDDAPRPEASSDQG